jgi:hypothetical protein
VGVAVGVAVGVGVGAVEPNTPVTMLVPDWSLTAMLVPLVMKGTVSWRPLSSSPRV